MADKVKLIKDCFEAFGRGDVAFIVAQVTDDVDWRGSEAAELPYRGNYKGPQGVGQFFTAMAGALDVKTWEPKRVFATGEDVVATGAWSATVKSTGRSFASQWAMVFGFRGDKIASFHVFEDSAMAAAAFRA